MSGSVELFDNTGIDAGKTRIYEDITSYPGSSSNLSENVVGESR